MLSYRPLFSLWRGDHEEVCVLGEVVAVTGSGVAFQSGEAASRLPARSLLKPFQFLATGLARADTDLDPRQTAALGSISATAAQRAALAGWYHADTLASHLRLPLDPEASISEPSASEPGRGAEPASCYGHPCFSKHMAILAACGEHGWPLESYTSLSHPYHRELLRVLERELGRPAATFEFVTDGCQLPTPLLLSTELGNLYRKLAAATDDGVAARLRQAMQSHPSWIGASDRFDTRLMLDNPGLLIAKEGADGLLAVGVLPSRQQPDGVGLVVKLASGHHPAWAVLALQPFLTTLGLRVPAVATPGQNVVWHVDPSRDRTSPMDISPALDAEIAVWPEDVAFRRSLSTEIGTIGLPGSPAWELCVSSIQTTLHVGAHADAPNHFTPTGVGIDRVPLGPYRGPCQVIEIDKPRGSLIVPDDIPAESLSGRVPRAPRVLFKTGSYPDPRHFNSDFVAFSPELIAWLEASGVVLVGIDTPSVDPFSSKSLPTHHATRQGRGLAILEGLELTHVKPGLYELIALPLRLRDADASPVRATLWPLR